MSLQLISTLPVHITAATCRCILTIWCRWNHSAKQYIHQHNRSLFEYTV